MMVPSLTKGSAAFKVLNEMGREANREIPHTRRRPLNIQDHYHHQQGKDSLSEPLQSPP